MYKPKPCGTCDMPAPGTSLKALALNASLKHGNAKHGVRGEIVRLADEKLPVGLRFRETADDDWPRIVETLKAADIVIFATPIWWGGRSSLMQRAIERMDALDEEYHTGGQSALYNKVAGIVITGSEDGALSTMGSIMMVLTWMGFTLPPECAAYWVGEVGRPPSEERATRRKNEATMQMAKNLARKPRVLRAAPEEAPAGAEGRTGVGPHDVARPVERPPP